MKERALVLLKTLAFCIVAVIGIGVLAWLFPLWGLLYIITGFNYFDFILDILYELV